MEILSETTHWISYLLVTIGSSVVGILFILGFIGMIYARIRGDYMTFGDYIGGILCACLGVLLATAAIATFQMGPEKSYTATISDFNEVYEQGYEIERQIGKLYILSESEAE